MTKRKGGEKQKVCPFWSADDGRCTVSGNGLFIPLENYIINFCNSDGHTQCSQYNAELSLTIKQRKSLAINRRQHARVPSSHQIILKKLNNKGRLIPDASGFAQVVDLSAGGMRINLQEPLIHDTLLNFAFESVSSAKTPHGVAQVKWCLYEKDSMMYYVGLSFHNKTTANSISSSFGLAEN